MVPDLSNAVDDQPINRERPPESKMMVLNCCCCPIRKEWVLRLAPRRDSLKYKNDVGGRLGEIVMGIKE